MLSTCEIISSLVSWLCPQPPNTHQNIFPLVVIAPAFKHIRIHVIIQFYLLKIMSTSLTKLPHGTAVEYQIRSLLSLAQRGRLRETSVNPILLQISPWSYQHDATRGNTHPMPKPPGGGVCMCVVGRSCCTLWATYFMNLQVFTACWWTCNDT